MLLGRWLCSLVEIASLVDGQVQRALKLRLFASRLICVVLLLAGTAISLAAKGTLLLRGILFGVAILLLFAHGLLLRHRVFQISHFLVFQFDSDYVLLPVLMRFE